MELLFKYAEAAGISDNILVLLFLLNVFLLLIGMFLDAGPAVLVLGPVPVPVPVPMMVPMLLSVPVRC